MSTNTPVKLNRSNLGSIAGEGLVKPTEIQLNLPEKVLQFGTGALLRGLPDYFIDEANRKGIFNGRVVVVKSTGSGTTDAFDEQDGLYTLCIRGVEKGEQVSRNIINAAISRVISANENWQEVLAVAKDPEVQIVISNTTEVGIQYLEENVLDNTPASFPGKLLACLYARYNSCTDKSAAGMIILPTELISDNGKSLAAILLKLAAFNKFDTAFTTWLGTANTFCNTLVDCIVPGYPDADFRNKFTPAFGYTDHLLTVSEVYRLWAIEGDEHLAGRIGFANLNNGIVIAADIQKFKELKLRLLNGTHTLTCGLAFLCGIPTVKAAMDDRLMSTFIEETMLLEIAPAIPFDLPQNAATEFAHQVLDRFRNPGIAHPWISITMQYSSKMRQRCIPVLQKYYQEFNAIPARFALGFAAYLLFTKPVKKEGEQFYGLAMGVAYPIKDDQAGYFFDLWQEHTVAEVVQKTLQNKELWGIDLTGIPGLETVVRSNLEALQKNGAMATLAGIFHQGS